MDLGSRTSNGDSASQASQTLIRRSRRSRRALIIALVTMLCLAAPPRAASSIPSSGQVGLIVAGIAATGAGIGIVIFIVVNHSRHTLTGCVSSGQTGMVLQTSDNQTFLLRGDSSSLKAGDRVKLHGSRVKPSGDGTTGKAFMVEKLQKDYGACH